MTTHDLREKYKMSQKEFAEYFNIPVATVRNWDSRGSMPEYVHEMARENLTLKHCMKEIAGTLDQEEPESKVKEVLIDGEWWDSYSTAPDLYKDPYTEERDEDCAE